MWAMREPAGIEGGCSAGGGSAGGGTSTWPVGGGKVGRAMSCVPGDMAPGGSSGVQSSEGGAKAHEASETEGARVVEAGVMSPGEGV